MSAKRASRQRIPVLDGFRAIAILSVMASHLFGYSMLGRQWPLVPRLIAAVTAPGWLGVDLFFVLSGFLITSILVRNRQSADYYRPFFMRRFLRIVPLYFVVLTIIALVFNGGLPFYLACLFFGANLCSLWGIVVPAPASIFWSLAVEEHFYALWPIAVRRLADKSLAILAGGVFLLEPALRYVCARRGIDTYFYSWFRFDGLALGALMAMYMNSARRKGNVSRALIRWGAAVFVCGVVGLIAGGGMKEPSPLATLRFSVAQVGFATVMLAALEFPGRWSAALGSKPARITADLSYCLYLVHLAIAAIYDQTFGRVSDFPGVLLRAAAVAAASYAIAWLSLRYFEGPLLSLRQGMPVELAPALAEDTG